MSLRRQLTRCTRADQWHLALAYRWGIWGPFDFISTMAEKAGFPHKLALYLISIVKYVRLRSSAYKSQVHPDGP